ncbi:hypothetical protein J6590_090116 [Homalodisca vitripennis]|nr:hypothetical protein J6590_090116 [Homalodisca vitripennis]
MLYVYLLAVTSQPRSAVVTLLIVIALSEGQCRLLSPVATSAAQRLVYRDAFQVINSPPCPRDPIGYCSKSQFPIKQRRARLPRAGITRGTAAVVPQLSRSSGRRLAGGRASDMDALRSRWARARVGLPQSVCKSEYEFDFSYQHASYRTQISSKSPLQIRRTPMEA